MALMLPQMNGISATTSLVNNYTYYKLTRSLFIKLWSLCSFFLVLPQVHPTNTCQLAPITGPSDTADVRRVPVQPLKLEDAIRPPTNLYIRQAPHTATIISVRIISSDGADAIYEIIFDHRGFLSYWEGQAFGVIVPNADNPFQPGCECTDKPKIIFAASSRYGDYSDSRTSTICVNHDNEDETFKYLCNAKPGDHLQLVGPTFEATLLGDYKPTATHIFVGKSGTAIAPFRAHLRRFFKEGIPTFKFLGDARLFYGEMNNPDSRLYDDEFKQYKKDYPRNFHYNFFDDISEKEFDLLVDDGAYIYLVGPQRMVHEVENVFRGIATRLDQDWEVVKRTLVMNNQWRVQVYNY